MRWGCATLGDAFHHISFAFTRFLRRRWLTPLMRHPQDRRACHSYAVVSSLHQCLHMQLKTKDNHSATWTYRSSVKLKYNTSQSFPLCLTVWCNSAALLLSTKVSCRSFLLLCWFYLHVVYLHIDFKKKIHHRFIFQFQIEPISTMSYTAKFCKGCGGSWQFPHKVPGKNYVIWYKW